MVLRNNVLRVTSMPVISDPMHLVPEYTGHMTLSVAWEPCSRQVIYMLSSELIFTYILQSEWIGERVGFDIHKCFKQ